MQCVLKNQPICDKRKKIIMCSFELDIYLEDDHGKVYLSKKGFSAVLQGEKKHKTNHIGHFRSKAYKQSWEDIRKKKFGEEKKLTSMFSNFEL